MLELFTLAAGAIEGDEPRVAGRGVGPGADPVDKLFDLDLKPRQATGEVAAPARSGVPCSF